STWSVGWTWSRVARSVVWATAVGTGPGEDGRVPNQTPAAIAATATTPPATIKIFRIKRLPLHYILGIHPVGSQRLPADLAQNCVDPLGPAVGVAILLLVDEQGWRERDPEGLARLHVAHDLVEKPVVDQAGLGGQAGLLHDLHDLVLGLRRGHPVDLRLEQHVDRLEEPVAAA